MRKTKGRAVERQQSNRASESRRLYRKGRILSPCIGMPAGLAVKSGSAGPTGNHAGSLAVSPGRAFPRWPDPCFHPE